MTALKTNLQSLLLAASDIRDQAVAEDQSPQMLAHLTIVQTRIAAALGECSPRTPARFETAPGTEEAA